jgi:hypothetical protein
VGRSKLLYAMIGGEAAGQAVNVMPDWRKLNASGRGGDESSQPRNELRNFAIDDLALSFGFPPSSLFKCAIIGERIRRQGADKTDQ